MDPPPPPSKKSKLTTTSTNKPQFDITSFKNKFNLPSTSSTIASSSSNSISAKSVASSDLKGKGKEVLIKNKKKTTKDVIVIDDSDDEEEDADVKGEDESNMLWIDRYAPTNRESLAIHPKKLISLSEWLTEAYNPKLLKYRKILILSGPSGSGKTTALKILAKEAGVNILEFRNSSNFNFGRDDFGRESLVNQFSNFLMTAGMAPSLEFESTPSEPGLSQRSLSQSQSQASSSKSKAQPLPPLSTNSKRLILLEDLPNISHYPTKMAFRSSLNQYLISNRITCPLVIIISEALVRPGIGYETENTGGEGVGGSGRGDSIDSRSICGVEILGAPGCREIVFNPIAVTIMKKALIKTLDKIYSPSSSSSSSTVSKPKNQRPSNETLELIINHSNGDIRSALMSLEFLASNPPERGLKGVTDLSIGTSGTTGRKRKEVGSSGKGNSAGQEEIKKLLQFVTARENSLFLFHALGKVLYNKRWGEDTIADKKDEDRLGLKPNLKMDRLPKHLRENFTRAPSKVDPDTMFSEAPIDSDVFLSYIHHNYPAFTESDHIDECFGLMENFSQADALMRMEGEEWLRRVPLTSQYSFNLAVRGTLLHLPSPITKQKRVLRKSALWENLRTIKFNEESIDDLYKKRDGFGLVDGFISDSTNGGQGGKREGGCQRGKRSLVIDIIPWLNKIWKGNHLTSSQEFLSNLGIFPTSISTDIGEAIGEKETEDPNEDLEEEEEKLKIKIKFEEGIKHEDGDEGEGGEGEEVELDRIREEVKLIEELFDPDDDIIDFDD